MGESPEVQRAVLPIPDQSFSGVVTYDAKDPDTAFPPITAVRPPSGAPNVLVVLLDDVGFGASSAFGGPVNMPTAERLAGDGLRFTRFHTTALCSPTRATLLSGRNHHTVGMGGITEIATSAPGYSSVRPEHVPTAGGDPSLERLLDRSRRQVSRGAGVGIESGRPVRSVAQSGERVRVLLRLHRRRDQPVLPGAARWHGAGCAGEDPGRGLSLDG